LAWRGARRQAEEKACGLSFEAAARLTFCAAPAVEMIAAAVAAFGEIDKLPANIRRTGQAGESAQPGGHLPVMIAVRKRFRRYVHGQCRQDTQNQKTATRDDNIVTAIAVLACIAGRLFTDQSYQDALFAECAEQLIQNVRKGQTRRSLRTGQSSLNTGVLALRTCAVTHR
jgi:hypothetical protein